MVFSIYPKLKTVYFCMLAVVCLGGTVTALLYSVCNDADRKPGDENEKLNRKTN